MQHYILRPQSELSPHTLSQWHQGPHKQSTTSCLKANLMWCEAQPRRASAAPGEGPRSKFSSLVQWDTTVDSYGDQYLAMCLALKVPCPCALTHAEFWERTLPLPLFTKQYPRS